MKRSPLSAALLAVLCCLIFAPGATAQSVDGYTSIEYDEFTNTVVAYSETTVDYDLMYDYQAYVTLSVVDSNLTPIGSRSARDSFDNGFISVTLEFSAAPDTIYTAKGTHRAYAQLYNYDYDYGYYPYRQYYYYYDYWWYGFYEGQGIYTPWYYRFFHNGFREVSRRSRLIPIGTTHDSASVTVAGQKPTSLSVVSVEALPTGSGNNDGCTASQDYGIKVAIKYQVNDQNGRPINKGNMRPQEKVTNQIFNGTNQGDPVPNWEDIGPSRNSLSSRLTNANGQFYDVPFGICAGGPFTYSFDQQISILIGSRRYNVRSHHVTASSSAYGGGTISNGSDIQKSRQ